MNTLSDTHRMMLLKSSFARSLLAAIAGFIGYGGWAYYVNLPYGADLALMIGVVQGSYSFALTLIMTLVTEWLYRMFTGSQARVSLVMLVACPALFVTPYLIHVTIGTPEIIMTILPGFLMGCVYTLVYLLGLEKMKAANDSTVAQTGGS